MHGGDMKVRGHQAVFSEHQSFDGRIVGRFDDGAPHADVVERLDVDLHAATQGLRRFNGQDPRARDRPRELDLLNGKFVDGVDAAGGQRRGLVLLLVMVEVDLVQEFLASPVMKVLAVGGLGDALEDAAIGDAQLRQGVGPGADRIARQRRLEGRMHHQGTKFAAVLGDRQNRFREVEAQSAAVENFDAILQRPAHRLALGILLAGGFRQSRKGRETEIR